MLREENRYRYLRRFFGETLLYDYDARGRLLRRLHEGELAGDGSRPFVEERRYVWKMDRLAAETAYGPPGTGIGGYGAIRWRKTYVPGPSGLDDAPQVVFGVYQPGPYSGTASTYTFITDEMDTNLGIVAEDEGGTASEPPVPVCYLYTPYGQAHTETGPELLRVRFDVEATTARNAGAGTVTQEVPELKEATPGALVLTWSSPIAPASLEAGLHVERLVAGEGWVAVPESELSIGTRPSANPLTDTSAELRVLRLAGWQEATSYRVRLTPTLEDRLGRPFGKSETLQWSVPAAPSEEDDVPPPQYEQRYPRRYESYEAAGATVGGRFPGGQSHLFQGLWTDPVTGISYARARWLDSRTGHWLSEDPLFDIDSSNLYAFVGWMPSMGTDPMGRACTTEHGGTNPLCNPMHEMELSSDTPWWEYAWAVAADTGGNTLTEALFLNVFADAPHVINDPDASVREKATAGAKAVGAAALNLGGAGVVVKAGLGRLAATKPVQWLGQKVAESKLGRRAASALFEDVNVLWRRGLGRGAEYRTTPMHQMYRGEELGKVSIFRGRRVPYLSKAERLQHQLKVRNGKLYDAKGQLLDTGEGSALYVMDSEGRFFARAFSLADDFHHSSFLSGEPVAGAGIIRVRKGRITMINDSSGHYRPSEDFFQQVLDHLHRLGVDTP